MANTQAIRAGKAFVELFANDRRLVRGLKAASAKLKAWGAGVTAMGRKVFAGGLVLAAPLAAATKIFSAMGDTVAKMSLRTGVSAESPWVSAIRSRPTVSSVAAIWQNTVEEPCP